MTKKQLTQKLNRALAVVLTIAALAAGQVAWAMSSFTVSSPNSDNTFRITRTGNTAVAETIDWRVVSLSAIAGVHFTGDNGNYSGTVTFAADEPYKDVTISENTPGNNAYKYQNGTTRSYRFEVIDKDGSILASKDRTMTTGTSVPSSGLFNEKEITIYTSEVQYSDAGYDQNNNPHYIESSAYYNLTGIAPKAYYTLIGAQLRSTISLDAKEKNNGYQYIQVLINNTSTCDYRSGCSDGDPGNINLSRYMAGFDHQPSSANTTYAAYTFPVTSQPNNCSEVSNAWSNGVTNKLYTQKFNINCRATDGRLILPLDFNTLVVRFNASGGGNDHDEWLAKNVKAHIQAVDGTAPTVLDNYKVSGGRHQKGAIIYVSVPFSEIVEVEGTPRLNTSWGNFDYYAGSGTNVLTFRGEISSTAEGTLYASGIGTNAGISAVKDLAGNTFTPFTHEFGISLDSDYAWTTADFISLGANTYEIASKTDLRHLALLVNKAKNPCTGLTFSQTQDITCDNTYTPIGYYVSGSDRARFQGTYDGQGFTVSGITVTRTGDTTADGYVGLFGYVYRNNPSDFGTVKNVILANSTFTGCDAVGGIVGNNFGGIVQNCRVESTVTINAGANNAYHHGGIVGSNSGTNAKVIGCYSAAVVSQNSKSNCQHYGGIVGYNHGGTVKDCLYAGTTVTSENKKGAIVGFDEDNKGVFTNNYYTAISLGGVNGSDQDGARRARTVTLGENIALVGDETAYNASGLTAFGTTALQSGETIYSGEGQTLTLSYTGEVPAGYQLSFSATAGTMDGNTLTIPSANVTVSANVTPITYTVRVHKNNDNATGTMSDQEFTYDQEQQLSACAFSHHGEDLVGWTTNADGTGTTYTDQQSVTNLSSVQGTVIDLYAKWKHDWRSPEFTWDNYSSASARFTCNICDETVDIAAVIEDFPGGNYCAHVGFDGNTYGDWKGNNVIHAGQQTVQLNQFYYIGGGFDYRVWTANTNFTHMLFHSTNEDGSINETNSGSILLYRRTHENCTDLQGNTELNIFDVTVYGIKFRGEGEGEVTVNFKNLSDHSVTIDPGITGGTATYTPRHQDTWYWIYEHTIHDGDIVWLNFTPDESLLGKKVVWTVTDIKGQDVPVQYHEGNAYFIMPEINVNVSAAVSLVDFADDGHSGDSEADAYIIYNKDQLDLLASRVNSGGNDYYHKYIKLGADITYDGTANNYTPIGNDSHYFRGTFDGDGHTISGININSNNGYQGLFGDIGSGSKVKNVTLTNSTITAYDRVGGIAGFNGGHTVQNCCVESTVTIGADADGAYYHGGIVGQNSSQIIGCISSATVSHNGHTGCSFFGAIAGSNSSTIRECLAIGATASAYSNRGVIAGSNSGTLANNYYYNCTVSSKTIDIGTGTGSSSTSDVSDNDGAVEVSAVLSESETVPTELSGKVVFRREFKGGKASTVIFPFAHEKGTEGTYYTFGGVQYDGKWKATMTEHEGATLAANTPYLFVPAGTEAHAPVLFHGTAGYSTAGTTVNGDWSFKGVYETKVWTAGDVGNDYGFAATSGKATDGVTDVEAGDFVKLAEGAWIRPMRSYLTYTGGSDPWAAPSHHAASNTELPHSISVILVSANGSTTELRSIENGELRIENSGAWYTLNGVKLQGKPTTKGIYVNNGRKTVIK